MAYQRLRLKVLKLRVVLIVAALVSFCVSLDAGSGVFPSQAIAVATEAASRQLTNEANSFRTPLLAESLEHADRGPQEPEPLALIVKPNLVLPDNQEVLNKPNYTSFLLIHLSFTQPPERAPPF